ncbi:MAG: CRISPR-associated endoribonuclease Cas6, partial [Candidatus Aenigmatarchaeota archaeon]
PEELFPIAFSCGLGAKNSQGFGCIGIWRGRL